MSRLPQRIWFDRSFALGLSVDAFPELVERLRGTPLRLEERFGQVDAAQLVRRPEDAWSIQEHGGHLADLELLWLGRLDDLAGGLEQLRAADLENRATWDADHNNRSPETILADFRSRRAQVISVLESMGAADVLNSAMHPRLLQPMAVVDLCFFVAEHDDHHLATITALARDAGGSSSPASQI